jgi:hypothetical protein
MGVVGVGGSAGLGVAGAALVPFENVLVVLWWLWLLRRFCWRGSGWGVVRLRDWEIRWGPDDRVDLVVVVGEMAFVI